jgi:hypothetical protein
MLAQNTPNREDARAALLARAGCLAHLGDRTRSGVDGLGDLSLANHGAVAEDHGLSLWCEEVRLALV